MNARMVAAVGVCTLAVLVAPATSSAATSGKVDRLERQVAKWQVQAQTYRRQRNVARRQRDRAREAIGDGLAAQVTEVAKAGHMMDLYALIFEPIRVNWPCGSTLYQGESFWSIDVDVEGDTDYSGDVPVTRSCR